MANKNTKSNAGSTVVASIISLFWTTMFFFAIFLSFKCNKGFSLGGFLGACCCSPFYIAYKLGTSWDVCFS